MDNFFSTFNTSFIPRDQNQTADSLALEATFFKVPQNTQLRYPIEVRQTPSILDNVKHWRVFQDDPKIKKFLELTSEFSTSHIDEEQDYAMDEFPSFIEQSIANHKIIEVKGNFFPKGLFPLERLFLKYDTLVKPAVQSSKENVSSYNIGTESQPKIIKISKLLTKESKKMYISLVKKIIKKVYGYIFLVIGGSKNI